MAILGIKSRAELGGRLRSIARISGEAVVASDEADEVARRNRRRVTIRHIMFLVAFWAVVLGAWRHCQWNAYCVERARYHAGLEAFHSYAVWPGPVSTGQGGPQIGPMKQRPELAIYHSRMRRKWERAAARPWVSVEPDPPPP
jgi:hypothetical protein